MGGKKKNLQWRKKKMVGREKKKNMLMVGGRGDQAAEGAGRQGGYAIRKPINLLNIDTLAYGHMAVYSTVI